VKPAIKRASERIWKGDALSLRVRSTSANALDLERISRTWLEPEAENLLIKVECAAVNPIDTKAAILAIPNLLWPRVPGRDFAGTVVSGPDEWVGKKVWGMGAGSGLSRHGTHAQYFTTPLNSVCELPRNLGFDEAGASILPFITAFEGYRTSGGLRNSHAVIVLGANGKVGQAAVQLAAQSGARVFGVEQSAGPYLGHACGPVEYLDSGAVDFSVAVRERTNGKGADIIFNTVGSPYFETANKALAIGGHHILISTIEPTTSINLLEFYRGRFSLHGVDSLKMTDDECTRTLNVVGVGFESGLLKPYKLTGQSRFGLSDAAKAYAAVYRGTADRIVIRPWD
jgi:NADPH2:quinone reductase